MNRLNWSCTAEGDSGEEDFPDEAGGDRPAGGLHGLQGVLRLHFFYSKILGHDFLLLLLTQLCDENYF